MSSEKVEELTKLFTELREKAAKAGQDSGSIRRELLRSAKGCKHKSSKRWLTKLVVFLVIPLLLGSVSYYGVNYYSKKHKDGPCLVEVNEIFGEMTRAPTNCSLMCEGLKSVPKVSGLTREEFIEKYAYKGRPVVVTDAARNWSALDTFNFTFLKSLYDKEKGSYSINDEECQFFPYKTDFESLEDAFNMPKERAEFKGEPWYFGWSNCAPAVREKLREHYTRPYFLPAESETSQQDWLFMGGPGLGAQIHIDSVERPSWQAQLSGTKIWTLIPPPECEHVCHTMKVPILKGEVLVIDTNQWFHRTEVAPGDISITIGAEFD